MRFFPWPVDRIQLAFFSLQLTLLFLVGDRKALRALEEAEGMVAPQEPVEEEPQAEPPASRRVFPKRITERWLEDNVPSMTRTEFIALAAEMRSRGWSDGWIIDYALSFHPESEGIRARCPIGEGDNARGFEMPQRATTRWAERIAPGLTADELAFVTAELLERGWSPGDIDDYLYVYAKPEYLTQQGFG